MSDEIEKLLSGVEGNNWFKGEPELRRLIAVCRELREGLEKIFERHWVSMQEIEASPIDKKDMFVAKHMIATELYELLAEATRIAEKGEKDG